jgi:predicted acylesterase/phospholipase RssA
MTKMYAPWVQRMLHFFRNMFHALFVFFPGFLFLLLTMVAFWDLSQGEDLMVLATEQKWFFIFFELLLAFLVLVSWYAARIVANAKKSSPNTVPGYLDEKYYTHIPRFIGFSFFTIILLAFAQTPFFFQVNVPKWIFYGLLVLSVPYYIWLSKFFTRRFKVIKLNKLFYITVGLILGGTVVLTLYIGQYSWPVLTLMVLMLLILQACFLVLVITRREIIERKEKAGKPEAKPMSQLAKRTADMVQLPHEEINFHFGFLIISIIALAIYVGCTLNVRFAGHLGSFPFVLLAFAVFLGVGFILSFISVRIGLNIHFVVLFFIFLFGQWTERHHVALVKKDAAAQENFSNKAGLREYFLKWVQDRDSLISQSNEFPVYFVLSDGGASRSGYWVASVLGKMEDTSARSFSRHLFCLSGASGGSVGNAAFYALLHNAGSQPGAGLSNNQTFYQAGKEYLRSDFLTYTLSRMLGHDFFVQAFPFSTGGDRAKALTDALEDAPGNDVLLKSKLATPLSAFSVYKNKANSNLPIICINATRMQDGRPSVISTIDIDPVIFNNRVDVLKKLQPGLDMKLSTAVVLGASFPYISPAGRIDEKRTFRNGTVRELPNYFVDGGYVDNSGAGVVHEMLIKLNFWRDSILTTGKDSSLYNNVKKLSFYVMHISNGGGGELLLKKVNPFVNDLAAPIKTLVGSYNVQTSINDSRLKSYLAALYRNERHYKPINLYRVNEPLSYSMNWVISKRTLDSMDVRLHSPEVQKYFGSVIEEMRR